MNAFVWGAVVGGLVCIFLGLVAGADRFDESEYKAHIRTEWTAWFILLFIASGVSIYIYNYAGG